LGHCAYKILTCITFELPPKSLKVTDGFLASISFHFFFFFGAAVTFDIVDTDGRMGTVLGCILFYAQKSIQNFTISNLTTPDLQLIIPDSPTFYSAS
jgi:hypothetical protein